MSARCDQLSAYIDGQLDDAEAEAFAHHLATCEACQAASHEALQLVALETAARLKQPAHGVAARARRRWWFVPALSIAAAAAVAITVWWSRDDEPRPAAPQIALWTSPVRHSEARISHAAADHYRPYHVARAGTDAPRDAIPLATLSALEQQGDVHGVAAALLVMSDPRRATEYLARAAPGADVTADRALIQYATGALTDALITLDGVLEAAPRHPQALWNRALVLRDLGLPLSAAESYRAVAALGEPGWADEARTNAEALTAQLTERQAAFDRLAYTDGPRLATAGDAVTPEVARRFPGMARLRFYDAVRAAGSADAVRALAPLAATLDGIHGGAVLARHVERIAAADFRRRGPLAQRYAALVAGTLDDAGRAQLIPALRAAQQDDMLLGAILLLHPQRVPAALVPELRRVADALGDPWFHLLAVEHTADQLVAVGDHAAVEALVLPELARCTIDYRCVVLDLVLAESYVLGLRLADTRRVVADGWARARRGGEWYLELRLLQLQARLASVEDDVAGSTLPLVRAYAGETVLRSPTCDFAAWVHEIVALTLVNRQDFARAHAELQQGAEVERTCTDHASQVAVVEVKARVLRDPAVGSASEVSALRAEIAALRALPSPGARAALDQIEGRLLIDRDAAAATALLERAIAAARRLAPDDVEARMVRSYATSILALDAARAGAWDRVWTRLGEAAGWAPPDRCAVGVVVEDRASVVVIRDAAGAAHGVFEAARPAPTIDATTLVPAGLRAALRDCAAIEVIARPPVHGIPGLLPVEMAWSYRSAAASAEPATREPPRRVVISDVEPPAALGLPRLLPWRSTTPPDVAVAGAPATPTRVLAELADASFVEIHAHGMVQASVADASFLMLSPEADGRYALTAGAIRRHSLRRRPIVVLAACHAATTARYRHEAWSLPTAFIAAGARAVIASTDIISDAEAGGFFDDLRARIERGIAPAIALRDTRAAWSATHPAADWTRSLMVFQ